MAVERKRKADGCAIFDLIRVRKVKYGVLEFYLIRRVDHFNYAINLRKAPSNRGIKTIVFSSFVS